MKRGRLFPAGASVSVETSADQPVAASRPPLNRRNQIRPDSEGVELQSNDTPVQLPDHTDDFDKDLERLEEIRATVRLAASTTDVVFLLSFIDKLWNEYSRTLQQLDDLHEGSMTDQLSSKGTTEAILPCPFCGVQAKVRRASNAWTWIIGCTSVRCDFRPEFQHTDKQYAIKRWNRRA